MIVLTIQESAVMQNYNVKDLNTKVPEENDVVHGRRENNRVILAMHHTWNITRASKLVVWNCDSAAPSIECIRDNIYDHCQTVYLDFRDNIPVYDLPLSR